MRAASGSHAQETDDAQPNLAHNARAALELGALLRGVLAGPNAWLMQLTLIAVVVSLLACAYLWQSSALRDIQKDTRQTERMLIEAGA